MDIRQCRKCRKLYQYNGNSLCLNCVEELDRLFNEVRNYIDEHPTAGMDEICSKTGTDGATVVGWLREGRLILATSSVSLIKCESCGEPIRTGRFCEKCAKSVKDQLQSAAKAISTSATPERKAPTTRPGAKMHVDFKKK